jgi:hypothetical protein
MIKGGLLTVPSPLFNEKFYFIPKGVFFFLFFFFFFEFFIKNEVRGTVKSLSSIISLNITISLSPENTSLTQASQFEMHVLGRYWAGEREQTILYVHYYFSLPRIHC